MRIIVLKIPFLQKSIAIDLFSVFFPTITLVITLVTHTIILDKTFMVKEKCTQTNEQMINVMRKSWIVVSVLLPPARKQQWHFTNVVAILDFLLTTGPRLSIQKAKNKTKTNNCFIGFYYALLEFLYRKTKHTQKQKQKQKQNKHKTKTQNTHTHTPTHTQKLLTSKRSRYLGLPQTIANLFLVNPRQLAIAIIFTKG